jgi:mannose-1-phosphate guanylyltransferase/mannose-6-phosphate isomerase
MVAAQIHALNTLPEAIILEPEGRSTAPAIAVGALEATKNGEDPVLLVLPADHLIQDLPAFAAAVQEGYELAQGGEMVTFGIEPSKPETGYGYIKKGPRLSREGVPIEDGGVPAKRCTACRIEKFVEKPDYPTACEYVVCGEYLWNSGMFMFRGSVLLEELAEHAPAIVQQCTQSFSRSKRDLDFLRLDAAAFCSCQSTSIDYAVMERTRKAAVVSLNAGWSDVGSWSALHEVREKDGAGNVIVGDVILDDVHDCYVHASTRMVAAVGIRNQVLVETKDAVLVAPLERAQDVKNIVNKLKVLHREEARVHSKVYRPWGSYERVDFGDRFQVKRITVNPGARLSLQKHHHRAEHWVVVKGTAKIVRGSEETLLSEDQSTYVPLGTVHRLENPGRIPLELIEIQTGSYLGEDDIVRLEDLYGRIEES